jgi:hypothetical protein
MPLRSVDATVSPELEQVCLRSLAKHPADRLISAQEFAAELRSLKSGSATKRRLVGPLIVLLAILVVGASAAVGWMLVRSQAASSSSISRDGVLVFDGKTRIITPLERFAPVTIEAWVRPDIYRERAGQFIVGSDLPTRWGNGLVISGAVLAAEYIPGATFSDKPVPLHEWSHLSVVFGLNQTRLYLNGKNVHVGPKTQAEGGTPFVIGCAGRDTRVDYFKGQIRAVRISKGERYAGDFKPDVTFSADPVDSSTKAVLIYDGSHVEGDRVIDLSGDVRSRHDGRVSRE